MPTLLVALDGSPFADAVLPVAVGIARHMKAQIVLASVLDSEPWRYATGGAPYADRRLERELEKPWRDAVLRHIEGWRAQIAALPDAPPVSTRVFEGAVVDSLLQCATDVGASMLVITTHGRSGLERAWLGSVTDALIRRAPLPVVAVRPSAKSAAVPPDLGAWALRRVLVPLDGSQTSEAVLAPLRAGFGDTIEYLLMRAVTPLHPLLRAIAIGGEYERDLAEQLATVLAYLRLTEEKLRSNGVRVSHCAPVEFEPPRAICDCAQEYGVDLIAMATHGRGPLPRALLGSVADKVLRTTDRPILIYRVEGADVA